MKNIETIKTIELNAAECATINAKGWITYVLHVIGFIADGWPDFKQGYVDGVEAANEN